MQERNRFILAILALTLAFTAVLTLAFFDWRNKRKGGTGVLPWKTSTALGANEWVETSTRRVAGAQRSDNVAMPYTYPTSPIQQQGLMMPPPPQMPHIPVPMQVYYAGPAHITGRQNAVGGRAIESS